MRLPRINIPPFLWREDYYVPYDGGKIPPRWYGVAYHDYERQSIVYAPLGANLLVRWTLWSLERLSRPRFRLLAEENAFLREELARMKDRCLTVREIVDEFVKELPEEL